jgi:hypothetical protein
MTDFVHFFMDRSYSTMKRRTSKKLDIVSQNFVDLDFLEELLLLLATPVYWSVRADVVIRPNLTHLDHTKPHHESLVTMFLEPPSAKNNDAILSWLKNGETGLSQSARDTSEMAK